MPLAPQAQTVLNVMTAAGVELDPSLTPQQVRTMVEAFATAAGPGDDVHRVENRTVPGPGGDIPVRVYRPEAIDVARESLDEATAALRAAFGN